MCKYLRTCKCPLSKPLKFENCVQLQEMTNDFSTVGGLRDFRAEGRRFEFHEGHFRSGAGCFPNISLHLLVFA